MDGLSGAASVIAVVDLSAKVATLCFQYYNAVKDAKKDIIRVKDEVEQVNNILGKVQQLLGRPDSARLLASREVRESLDACFMQLKDLDKQLEPRKVRQAISRFGVRALKWPFKAKDVEKIVSNLERCKQAISLALQVGQT
jgi:hypothetical protein